MALATAAINYRRVGPGKLYIVPAPSTGITTQEDYYALFFNTTTTKAYKPSNLKTGIVPYANAEEAGLDTKIKLSKAKFNPCTGTNTEMVTGIDTATASIQIYDVDPAHLVDQFGGQAADLITVAAATGVAARQIALLGPQSYNTLYTMMWEMPSSVIPGEFFHYIYPNVSMITDVEAKAGKKDAMSLKIDFQLMTSPFVMTSSGFGVVWIADDPTAPAL